MPSNILHSLVEYTTIPVDEKERVIELSSEEIYKSPFCYLSGHKLVEFTQQERQIFKNYVERGGFVFVDDCNHDIDGLFAKSFEKEMARTFGSEALQKIPNDHWLYRCFFEFEDGPPTTSFELNGWGMTWCTTTSKPFRLMGGSVSCTAIKTMAANGIMISEISALTKSTIPDSGSISSFTL